MQSTTKYFIGLICLGEGIRPEEILTSQSVESLSRDFRDCFQRELSQIGFLAPSDIWLLATDPYFENIIATFSITQQKIKDIPDYLWYHTADVLASSTSYKNCNTFESIYYLFNVCSYTPFRGKGIMKQFILRILKIMKQVSTKCPIIMLLQVSNMNLPAKRLYEGIGFQTIAKFTNGNELMQLVF